MPYANPYNLEIAQDTNTNNQNFINHMNAQNVGKTSLMSFINKAPSAQPQNDYYDTEQGELQGGSGFSGGTFMDTGYDQMLGARPVKGRKMKGDGWTDDLFKVATNIPLTPFNIGPAISLGKSLGLGKKKKGGAILGGPNLKTGGRGVSGGNIISDAMHGYNIYKKSRGPVKQIVNSTRLPVKQIEQAVYGGRGVSGGKGVSGGNFMTDLLHYGANATDLINGKVIKAIPDIVGMGKKKRGRKAKGVIYGEGGMSGGRGISDGDYYGEGGMSGGKGISGGKRGRKAKGKGILGTVGNIADDIVGLGKKKKGMYLEEMVGKGGMKDQVRHQGSSMAGFGKKKGNNWTQLVGQVMKKNDMNMKQAINHIKQNNLY